MTLNQMTSILGKTFMVISILTSMSMIGWAMQDEDFVAKKVRHLKEKLSLTDEQTIKVQDIYKKAMPQENSKSVSSPEDGKNHFEIWKSKMSQVRGEINAVLTDEQRASYAQMQADKKRHGFRHHYRRHGQKGEPDQRATRLTERLKQKLSLSDEQAAKIQNVYLNGLTSSAEEKRSFFKAQKEKWSKIQNELLTLLTDEQRQKYHQLKSQRKNHKTQGSESGIGQSDKNPLPEQKSH